MPYSTAPATAEGGVYVQEVNGHRVYSAMDDNGVLIPGVPVPLGDETEDDVIVALADALAASSPPRPGSVVRRASPPWLRLEP